MESTLESDQSWFPVLYFFLTGGGAVVSWNAMLNSFDYFDTKYPDFHVSFLFPIAIYVAQLLSSLVMAQLSAKLSYLIRLMGSYLLVTLILAFIPFEAILLEGTTLGFWLVMLLLFIVGFLSNICFSSAMGLASQLRGKYTTFIFLGSAFVGLFMSILREISSLIFTSSDSNEIFNVAFFFGMAALFLVIGLVLFSQKKLYWEI
jgi:MFS family permease